MKNEPESLVMIGGIHTIRIDVFKDFQNRKQCRITCIDDDTCTEGIDGEWIEEHEEGCFYATADGIEKIIEKLTEAKNYLTTD